MIIIIHSIEKSSFNHICNGQPVILLDTILLTQSDTPTEQTQVENADMGQRNQPKQKQDGYRKITREDI